MLISGSARKVRRIVCMMLVPAIGAMALSGVTANEVTLMSENSDPAASSDTASGTSFVPTVRSSAAASSRYAVFVSSAPNLAVGQIDRNGADDVFLYDAQTGEITLVSHTGDGVTAANGASGSAVIDDDGDWIAFASRASFGFFDNNPGSDIFLYERATGEVTLVSRRAADSGSTGNGISTAPVISRNGSYVSFESLATDLVTGQIDANGQTDVFVFSRSSGTMDLASHTGDNVTAGNGRSHTAVVAKDGTAAFTSEATDFGFTDANGVRDDVFAYDTVSGDLVLVSHIGDDMTTGDDDSFDASISADGQTIAFTSQAEDLLAGQIEDNLGNDVFLYDAGSGSIDLVSHVPGDVLTTGDDESFSPVVAADGQSVLFVSEAETLVTGFDDGNFASDTDVFRYRRDTAVVTLVSHTGDGLTSGDGESRTPSLSADGSLIAFESQARDLVTGQDDDNGDDPDVFIYRVSDLSVRLISHIPSDTSETGDNASFGPVISASGDRVYYTSQAENLETGIVDNNSGRVFNPGTPDVIDFQVATDSSRYVSRVAAGTAPAAGNGRSVVPGEIFDFVARGRLQGVSADGRYAVFNSTANDLIPGQIDGNGSDDVFLYDAETQDLRLVSHIPGDPLTAANSGSSDPVIAHDGSFIAFESRAADLVDGFIDGNPLLNGDVYVYDVATDSVALASHVPGDVTRSGNGGAENPTITREGGRVAFSSFASDLVSGQVDGNGASDVFVYDTSTAVLALVSHVGDGVTAADDRSFDSVIAADGTAVVFLSRASNLLIGFTDGNADFEEDVFLRDLVTDELMLVSRAGSATGSGNDDSFNAAISADGRRVAFESGATDLVSGQINFNNDSDVFVFDAATGDVALVSHAGDFMTTGNLPSFDPVISGNGAFIAFESPAQNYGFNVSTPTFNIYRYAVATGELALISGAEGSATDGANESSFDPVISASGQSIAFESEATNLIAGLIDDNENTDVFLNQAGAILLVSHTGDEVTTGRAESLDPNLSANGFVVTFSSEAGNLDNNAGDGNSTADAFRFDTNTEGVIFADGFE